MARFLNLLVILCVVFQLQASSILALKKGKRQSNVSNSSPNCTCGIFLTSQLLKGIPNAVESPAITVEVEEDVTNCGPAGTSQCSSKCLQELVKYMPTSSSMICGTVDREVFKEKAHLFLNVCNRGWTKSKVSTSKEICCKNSVDYKCPPVQK